MRQKTRLRSFILVTLALLICFSVPLVELVRFAAKSQLYSYILLIPFISCYLVWLKRGSLPRSKRIALPAGIGFSMAGLAVIAFYWLRLRGDSGLMREDDYLAVMMLALLLLFLGVCCFFYGRETLFAAVFPLSLLVFAVPIPVFAVEHVDSFLQSGSAWFAKVFFFLSGTPFLQDGLAFQLPDITIQIAPECSGIHSSLVLFITSLLAGYLLLKTPWKRTLIILFVIPLCLLRNGFRVFVIGELCVHMGPQMINAWIHRKGGPVFFVLSLIPLFLLLLILQKSERKVKDPSAAPFDKTPNTNAEA